MSTAAVLTPEERAKAAALFAQEAAMGAAWGREQTIPATKTIAESMARYADASESVEKQIAERHAAELKAARVALLAKMATDIFCDRTSSLDTDARKHPAHIEFAARIAKALLAEVEKT